MAMRLEKEPKQQRSRETLAIILQATIEVLQDSEDGSFSLRAVAERAGISQGTLYARFPTRDELLAYVHHSFWEGNRAAVDAWAAAHRPPNGPPDRPNGALDRDALERLVRGAIIWYTNHLRDGRPVLQALTRAMNHAPKLAACQRDESLAQLQRVTLLAAEVLGERWTPTVADRFEMAIRIVIGLVRDTSLLGPADPARLRLDVDGIAQHLTPIVMGLIEGC